jgi:hypothetical protein
MKPLFFALFYAFGFMRQTGMELFKSNTPV